MLYIIIVDLCAQSMTLFVVVVSNSPGRWGFSEGRFVCVHIFMSWCVRVCSSHYSNRFDPNHSIKCALLYKVANNPIRHQLPIIRKGKDEKINKT